MLVIDRIFEPDSVQVQYQYTILTLKVQFHL